MYETNVKPAIIPISTEGWCKEPLTTFKALPTTNPPVLTTIRIIYKISIVTAMYVFWWRNENWKVICAADPLALGHRTAAHP